MTFKHVELGGAQEHGDFEYPRVGRDSVTHLWATPCRRGWDGYRESYWLSSLENRNEEAWDSETSRQMHQLVVFILSGVEDRQNLQDACE